MRLSRVKATKIPHRWLFKLMFRLRYRQPVPDILNLVFYRHKYFGKHHAAGVNRVMRGPSDWTVQERELFAAYTSKLNNCAFCRGAHGAIAAAADDGLNTDEIIEHGAAKASPKIAATLHMIEILTLLPHRFGSSDLQPLREMGISDQAIEDVIYIVVHFCTINRIADALDFAVPTRAEYDRWAPFILKMGYG